MTKAQETQGKEAAEDKMETETEARTIKARKTMKKIMMEIKIFISYPEEMSMSLILQC